MVAPLQSVSKATDLTGTQSVTFTSNVGANKIIVAAQTFGGTTSAVKDAALNALTKVATKASSGGELTLWALDVPAGDVGAKPVLTMTSSGNAVAMLAQEVPGLLAGNTAAMLDGTAASLTGSGLGSTGSPAYTSTAAGEYLVAVYGDGSGGTTWTAPAGWTGDSHGINTSVIENIQISYKNSTGGAETGAYSLSGTSGPWSLITVAFQLAPAVGTIPDLAMATRIAP